MTVEKQTKGVEAISSGLTDFLNVDLTQLAAELGLTPQRRTRKIGPAAPVLAAE